MIQQINATSFRQSSSTLVLRNSLNGWKTAGVTESGGYAEGDAFDPSRRECSHGIHPNVERHIPMAGIR